ncbi:mannose-6-phosphate isomerase, partial [Candidatus Woesearchaeota archaeon]|nr:mannose-6-phosphate isomerase [Candidatus Woesearchaeota archaeon]
MKKFAVEKPWGRFIQYTHNEKATVKIIEVKPGGILSLQSHRKRKEFWVILEGKAIVTVGSKVLNLI